MDQFWREAADNAAQGTPALLATVMAVSGNIPAAAGARLLVTATAVTGAIDGGAADSVAVPRLRAALGGGAFTERLAVSPEVALSFGLIHGGAVELLVQPLGAFGPGLLEAIAAGVAAGEELLLATPLLPDGERERPGLPVLLRSGAVDGGLPAGLAADAAQIAAAGLPVRWTGDGATVFVDVVRPPDELVIFGASAIAEALCDLAARAGFQVTVIDTDPAVRDSYPAAREIVIREDALAALTERTLTPSTYVVSMMTGHRFYMAAAEALLRRQLRFLGMIGSRGRVANALKTLREQGFSEEEIGRLHAPLGLNLNARTPFEIAVSIIAELIAVRRGQTGPVSDWSRPAAAVAG